jgi:pimeloyl-ACP methyl ester carboxylesterase
MGGYVALAVIRQAPKRVARLALLDATAAPDTPEQSGRRREQLALAQDWRFDAFADLQFPESARKTSNSLIPR